MPTIEEQTRALAASIQLSPAYTNLVAARERNDADEGLAAQMQQLELLRMQYGHETAKGESADEELMDSYNAQFQALYGEIMENGNMQQYQAAAEKLDALLKRVTGILAGAAQGEDPAGYEPEDVTGCGGSCGGCAGCGN
ncbi:MAG: YlbF family regulator [Oscillospiraceae bacterium]|jgi:cell fate (sporulation/competence/biofilm development) regulator YlbF (YheA/YmcA/DUF963 family)|nr:YlbF family regulator [Oscillospiraceae bacterium]